MVIVKKRIIVCKFILYRKVLIDNFDIFDTCLTELSSVRTMNRYCGTIYPNSLSMPIRIELPAISQVYGRNSIYCRYEIINMNFDDYINVNITYLVFFIKKGTRYYVISSTCLYGNFFFRTI
jgi:hypothetical protein